MMASTEWAVHIDASLAPDEDLAAELAEALERYYTTISLSQPGQVEILGTQMTGEADSVVDAILTASTAFMDAVKHLTGEEPHSACLPISV